MADAQDLKSWDHKKSCGFESRRRHHSSSIMNNYPPARPRTTPALPKINFSAAFFGGCLLALTVTVSAGEFSGPSIGVMQENDLVVRTDRHYTQGLKFTFLASEHDSNDSSRTARWASTLPGLQMNSEAVR